MDLMQAIKERHSVRRYTDKRIEGEVKKQLLQVIEDCNHEGGLHIQLCLDEPKAFGGMMSKYGKFNNVKNYIALAGSRDENFEEKCGYYGEKVVLKAQQLGLNTCWTAVTYSKGRCAVDIKSDEQLLMVIAIGYGETSGVVRKTKPIEKLSRCNGKVPEWFQKGINAVQLAPSAMNQQRFIFELNGSIIRAEHLFGAYTKTDLGIAKYHFEISATGGDWQWQSG